MIRGLLLTAAAFALVGFYLTLRRNVSDYSTFDEPGGGW